MAKILIIYHSQHFGDTKLLAEALAEEAQANGVEIELINANERRLTLKEFQSVDGFAIGSPDYYSYVAGTIKTFFDDIWIWNKAGEDVKGRPAAVFFSHGTGGRGREPFEYFVRRFFDQIGHTVDSPRPPNEEAINACRMLGKQLAEHLLQE